MGSHGDLWPIPLLATLSALYCSASSCARPARGPRPTIPPMHAFGPLNRDGREILAGSQNFLLSARFLFTLVEFRIGRFRLKSHCLRFGFWQTIQEISKCTNIQAVPPPPRVQSSGFDRQCPTVPITFPGTPIFWFVGISIWLVRDEGLRNGMGTHRACSSRAAR